MSVQYHFFCGIRILLVLTGMVTARQGTGLVGPRTVVYDIGSMEQQIRFCQCQKTLILTSPIQADLLRRA
jgi:hypothetical protein